MTELYEDKKSFINYPTNLKKAIQALRYYQNPIFLMGSSNIRSLQYFGDYDLFTKIENIETAEKSYQEFERILNNTKEHDFMNLLEIKIQLKDGKKIREFVDIKTFKKIFDKIDFVKFDFILYSDSIYYELSSIYSFSKTSKSKNIDDEIKSLLEEIPELEKEDKYYKVLKRLYSISVLKKDILNIRKLTKFFNDNGKKYRIMSNLEAIEKIFSLDNSELTKNRIKQNLALLKTTPSIIGEKIESLKMNLNKDAENFYKNNFPQ